MTEQEWVGCTDPTPMLSLLREKASDRKLRLFAVACCRRTRHLLADEQVRNAPHFQDMNEVILVIDFVEGHQGLLDHDIERSAARFPAASRIDLQHLFNVIGCRGYCLPVGGIRPYVGQLIFSRSLEADTPGHDCPRSFQISPRERPLGSARRRSISSGVIWLSSQA